MFEKREKVLSLLPPLVTTLRGYDRRALLGDLQAGVTVAVFAVPQVMAYAMLAGLSPIQGLHAALIMSAVAALWGSSRYVNTGPTNSSALLTAAALLAVSRAENPLVMLFALTLLVGVFRMAAGGFRLGWIIQFVPESAFLGFTVGIGLLIALGQTHHLLGVAPSTCRWFPARLADTLADEGLPASPATNLAYAVSEADIVSSATLANDPLIRGEWVRPGTHVDLVGGFTPTMREADNARVRAASVFADTRAGALKDAGDLVIPIADGLLDPDRVVDLHGLCRGEHPGRKSSDEITLFKSVGAALEDLAAAILVFEAS